MSPWRDAQVDKYLHDNVNIGLAILGRYSQADGLYKGTPSYVVTVRGRDRAQKSRNHFDSYAPISTQWGSHEQNWCHHIRPMCRLR
jgi:hypothetical protein